MAFVSIKPTKWLLSVSAPQMSGGCMDGWMDGWMGGCKRSFKDGLQQSIFLANDFFGAIVNIMVDGYTLNCSLLS